MLKAQDHLREKLRSGRRTSAWAISFTRLPTLGTKKIVLSGFVLLKRLIKARNMGSVGLAYTHLLVLILAAVCLPSVAAKSSKFDEIVDHKDFKKLLKTKNNVLVAFHDLPKSGAGSKLMTLLAEASEKIKGFGTIAAVDCGDKEGKKLCKKLKVVVPGSQNYILKHFKDGNFHKDYDRKLVAASLVNFMKDQTAGENLPNMLTSRNFYFSQRKKFFEGTRVGISTTCKTTITTIGGPEFSTTVIMPLVKIKIFNPL